MAISQDDRISISKKLVNIPREKAIADQIIGQIGGQKDQALIDDTANKNLQQADDALINGYQNEFSRYDGNGRKVLTEQDMQDSGNRTLRNLFFPNDPTLPLPSVPDGVWKFFVPFAGSVAIGKNYDEGYTPVTKEQDLIDDINEQIAIIEALAAAIRSTGKECTESGTCSIPAYDNQVDCVGNGGVWTPGPDVLQPSDEMQDAAVALKDAVQAWEDFLNGTDAVIVTTDTDATRAAQNTAAKNDIANAISVIDTWQSLQDFDITTPITVNCATFPTIPSSTFQPSKFRDVELDVLKAEIAARQGFVSIRVGELNTILGSINQDINTGQILSGSGFYFKRFRFIDMRLNVTGGTLSNLIGLEQSQEAQEQSKAASDNAEAALSAVMVASNFRSPGTNTKTIHVLDATGFSPGDSAYVVADKQAEIAVNIDLIDGNRIVLDKAIPEKYRHTEFARLYKVL